MGTVGLAFGSVSSGTGFDVATTVSSILAIEQGIETPWKTQIATLQAQEHIFTTLGADLSTLSTRLQALTDFSGVLAQKEGSSSDTSVLALTSATAAASAGSHDIVVHNLAQTSSAYTSVVAATDALSGSMTIQVGSGVAHTITVGNSSNSVTSFAAAINAAGIGVRATILTDASGSRLALTSATSGSAGQLTVTDALNDETTGSAVNVQPGHTGIDASLTVDGIDLTSTSNTVTGVIPGVTFQLLNTSTSAVQVEITNNNTAVSGALSDFSGAYNAVINDLTAQEGKDSNGKAQPLFGDPTIALLQTQLASALLGGAASGSVSSLTQLGISVNNNGTVTFSAADFESKLNENFSDITGFFQNLGSFGNHFSNALDGLGVSTPQGALYLAQQQNSVQEASLNKNISDEETRIAAKKISLTKELNLADQILQSIPSQLDEINQIYSALTGYNTTATG